ncbi:MAG TPA: glycosyltransferase family 39 protein [Acidimicrobiales bacterium]
MHAAPAVLLLLLGGWLLLRRHGLWYDELYTAEVAPLPLADLWQAFVRGEGTIAYLRDAPPSYNFPYYVVAHVWLAATGLAADEAGLRLLSLLAMAAAVVVVGLVGTRLGGPRAGLAAGLAMAANPFVVQFSAEARGYALAVFATALSALGLVRWLDGGRSLRLYGGAGAVAGLMHWFALLPVAALAVAAVVLKGRRDARPVLATAALASLPALAVIGTAVANGVGDSGAEWISDVGLAVPRLLMKSWTAAHPALLVITLAAAAIGLARGGRIPRTVAGAWVLLPVVTVTVVEVVRPVFVDRYLLPSLAGLAVLVGLGVAVLPRRAGVAALAAVVAVSAWATVDDVRLGPKEDVRSAVAHLAAWARPGEPIVAAARWDALGVEHYARRHHRQLVAQLVLPPSPVPDEPVMWVVRRAKGGVKGDRTKLEALDQELGRRSLRLTDERRFDGRYADVLVQRWS